MSNSNPELIRISFFVCLFFSLVALPWWLTFVLGVIGMIAFSWFVEAVFLMFYVEAVFSFVWIPWLALLMITALLVIELLTYYLSN